MLWSRFILARLRLQLVKRAAPAPQHCLLSHLILCHQNVEQLSILPLEQHSGGAAPLLEVVVLCAPTSRLQQDGTAAAWPSGQQQLATQPTLHTGTDNWTNSVDKVSSYGWIDIIWSVYTPLRWKF